jgi:hypothetical protein
MLRGKPFIPFVFKPSKPPFYRLLFGIFYYFYKVGKAEMEKTITLALNNRLNWENLQTPNQKVTLTAEQQNKLKIINE